MKSESVSLNAYYGSLGILIQSVIL